MSGKRHSETEIQHEGANLREQLHAIVSHELEEFADVDRIGEVSELQDKVNQFMGNLQKHFDSYIHEMEKENSASKPQDQAVEMTMPAEEPRATNSSVVNLEEEFHTYGITKANGISEEKKPLSYTLMQALSGTIIAVALVWVFWPAAEQKTPVINHEQITVETPVSESPVTVDNAMVTTDTDSVEPEMVASIEPESPVVAEGPAVEPTVEKASPAQVQPEPVEVVAKTAPSEPEAVVVEKPVEKQAAPELKGEKITVTAHFGNVRNAPDNSGKVISKLKKGDVVYKLEESDGWFHVRLGDASTAWVHNSVFAPRLQVAVDLGNIRSEPDSNGKIVTRLKKGAYVTKMGQKKDWYKVKLDSGTTAWAHSSIF